MPELQVGVKIALSNAQGKYLVLKRSAAKYPDVKSPWDIVGGRIDIGTALLENLKREVAEETRLEIIGEPRLVAAQDILRPDKHVVRLTFVGSAQGEPVLNEEHGEFKWLSRQELENLPGLDGFVRELLQKWLL